MKYKLRSAHKLSIGILLLIAVFFLLSTEAYRVESNVNAPVTVPFLQEGDYDLHYAVKEFSEGNQLKISSDLSVDSENHPGEIFVLEEITSLEGSIRFHLDKNVRSIQIGTILDTPDTSYLSHYTLQSVQLLSTDHYLMALLCFLSALSIFLLGKNIPLEKYRFPLLVVIFGLLASLPLANNLLFTVNGQDLPFHLARLESLYQGLRAGEFPVRIGSAQLGGYGSLSATMYPGLFLYPFALLRFFRISLMLACKLLIVSINIGCALNSYLAIKNITKSEKTGILMSALYTFSLYRLMDVYQRAALGESLALTFLPLVIWGIYEVLWGDRRKWYLLALGVSAIMQSHVLSFEMCTLFLIIAAAVRFVSALMGKISLTELGLRILAGAKATIATLLANASFLVPFLYFCGEDLQCFHMPYELSSSLLYFNQMFFSFAHADGTNAPLGSLANDMPLSIGGVLLMGALLFISTVSKKEEQTAEGRIGMHSLGYAAFALILCSWIFPWDILIKISWIKDLAVSLQFVWRFLGIASVFLCITTAIGLKLFEEKAPDRKWIYAVTAVLLFISTSYFFEMLAREPNQTADKMTINGTCNTDSMYMYYDGESFKAHHLDYYYDSAYIQTFCRKAKYANLQRRGSSLTVDVMPTDIVKDSLIFPIYYYPGYQVSVNGEPVDTYVIDGRLTCDMPVRDAHIEIRYTGLPCFLVGDIITLLSLTAFALGTLLHRTGILPSRRSPQRRKGAS